MGDRNRDQGPSDLIQVRVTDEDAEGHGFRGIKNAPATDQPHSDEADSQGPAMKRGTAPNVYEPPTDETEGHIARWSDQDLKEDIAPVTPSEDASADEDDAEGHAIRPGWSDQNLKQDIDLIRSLPESADSSAPDPDPETAQRPDPV